VDAACFRGPRVDSLTAGRRRLGCAPGGGWWGSAARAAYQRVARGARTSYDDDGIATRVQRWSTRTGWSCAIARICRRTMSADQTRAGATAFAHGGCSCEPHAPVHGLCTWVLQPVRRGLPRDPRADGRGGGVSTAKLVIIGNNCPPLRKSEIEYYAMLAKTGVHHYTGSACPSQCGPSRLFRDGLGLGMWTLWHAVGTR